MSVKHVKQSGLPADGGDPSVVNPSDWYAAHTIDNNTITTAMLATTGVAAGTYTNTTLTVGVDGRITSASNGGGGGGITNSAPSNTVMLSNGTNAVSSALTYDGTSKYVMNAPFEVGDGVTARDTVVRGGILYGWSNAGGTYDYKFDPDGPCYIDTIVGPSGHGTGTDETLAIGWTGGAVTGHGGPLLGQIDVRTNGNTIINKDSGAGYYENTSTYNTGASPRAAYGIQINNAAGRGTGTGALTTYGLYVDNPGNGQTNYGIYVARSGVIVAAGGLSVLAGVTALQATTTTTLGATAINATSVATTGNIAATGSLSATSQLNVGNLQIFGGSTENDIYFPSASNQNINLNASGTGTVRINSNSDGIANSGTGGLAVYAGNNGGTVVGAITAAGVVTNKLIATAVERLTTSGAASVAIGTAIVTGTGTALTLANGTVDGEMKNLAVKSGTGTITPANLNGGTVYTWSSSPASLQLVWDATATKWCEIAMRNMVLT